MQTLGFIGAGPVGTTFGVCLSLQGYKVIGVSDISFAAAERFVKLVPGSRAYENSQALADAADVVFITTADDFISKVSFDLKWRKGQVVVHCSGASTVQALESAEHHGAFVGSIHPCQSFASIEQAIENLPGSTFAIEAEEPPKSILTAMAHSLKGDIVYLTSEDKMLYHAAAAIACNYFVTIEKLATDLWKNFGKTPGDGIKAYMPLLKGTLANIATAGFPKCLTGPIARGDVATIRRHLAALEKSAPEILPLYRQLGLFTIPVGQAKGSLSQEKAGELVALLTSELQLKR
jgi:predicted short-subunit dehydrogenase-like oxidoreductase (DUF2520 family)